MPEMTMTVRWPDGRVEEHYSPSLVMHDHLRPGASYTIEDFTGRAQAALDEASERVRAKYGFYCTGAAESAHRIRELAATYPPGAAVEVLVATPFIKDCMVDKDKTHLIQTAIAQGVSQYGMQTFDQSIFGLLQNGLVIFEEALRWASKVDEFKMRVQGISGTGDQARDQMASTVIGAGGNGAVDRQPEITRFGK